MIEIPEERLKSIRRFGIKENEVYMLGKAILEGKKLPKHHGRLIDADELEECKEIMTTISGESKYAVRMDDIRNMSTIIEADKESEDKE